jgi:hypothetical protein
VSTSFAEQPISTKGERFLKKYDELRLRVFGLAERAFSEEDITGCMATLGILIERFLADTVFPAYRSTYTGRRFFYDALNRLHPEVDPKTGIQPPAIVDKCYMMDLHALRERYNEQKHDPSIQISLPELMQLLERSRGAIGAIVASGIGSLKDKVFESGSTFWIAGTDYVHQGITEIFVHLPVESEQMLLPPTLLTFFVKMDGWDRLISDLRRAGSVFEADQVLSQKEVEKLIHGDALLPKVYNGPIKPLLSSLNRLRTELVEDKSYNVHDLVHRLAPFTTLLLTLDLFHSRERGEHIVVEAVVARVNALLAEMGLPTDQAQEQITKEANVIVSLVTRLPAPARSRLSGPVWLDTESFCRLASIRNIRSPDHEQIAISPELRVILDAGRP